jgi:hypothetical protein
MTDHRILKVKFPPGQSDGPLTCTCRWKGLASTYNEHRRKVGAAYRKPSSTPLGPSQGTFERTAWTG